MTKEEVIAKCPSLFTSHKDVEKDGVNISKVSLKIVEDLISLGWNVNEVLCTSSKRKKLHNYVLAFTIPKFNLTVQEDDSVVVPELIMVGSNTSKTFRFYFSYYRPVSETRFYLPLADKEVLKRRHFYINFDLAKYSFEEVKNLLEFVLSKVQTRSKYVDNLIKENLTADLRLAYAVICFIRKKVPYSKITLKRIHSVPELTSSILLIPLRKVDTKSNAWNTYHTVLEKIIRGFKGTPRKEQKRLYDYRPVSDYEKVILISIQAYLDLQKLIQHGTKTY